MTARRAVAAGLVLGLLAALPASAEAVRVGVRSDARPFVFRDPAGDYHGFLVDLCRAAVTEAGYEMDLVEVTGTDRFDRLAAGDGQIDLLCDPTTLTLERAARWDFSQIVFIANATFAARREARPLDAAAAAAIGCAVPDGAEAVAAGWLEGSTSAGGIDAARQWGALELAPGQAVCPIAVAEHVEGVDRLCDPDGDLSYYFGDADILSAQIGAYRETGSDCAVSFGSDYLTYEPYALAVTDRTPGFRRAFERALYAVFRSPVVAESFAAHFGDREPSGDLSTLFGMYRIPPGVPVEDPPADR